MFFILFKTSLFYVDVPVLHATYNWIKFLYSDKCNHNSIYFIILLPNILIYHLHQHFYRFYSLQENILTETVPQLKTYNMKYDFLFLFMLCKLIDMCFCLLWNFSLLLPNYTFLSICFLPSYLYPPKFVLTFYPLTTSLPLISTFHFFKSFLFSYV